MGIPATTHYVRKPPHGEIENNEDLKAKMVL
jgi:hypothetical protein